MGLLFAYWVILQTFFLSKIYFFGKFFLEEYHQSVKQFGPRSGLIWVQTVCKGYHQLPQVGIELIKITKMMYIQLASKVRLFKY